jgi:hypothetical protein
MIGTERQAITLQLRSPKACFDQEMIVIRRCSTMILASSTNLYRSRLKLNVEATVPPADMDPYAGLLMTFPLR